MVNFFYLLITTERKLVRNYRLMTKTLTVGRSPLWALAIGWKSYFPIETLLVRSVLIRD